MDQSFSMGPTDAVWHYHSIYDSQHWQELYADPTFERHVRFAVIIRTELSSLILYRPQLAKTLVF